MPETPAQRTSALLTQLWQRNLPQMLERLALLDRAATAAAAHDLTPQLQNEAAAIAHKLAGSLGMFGFAEGTNIAREIEQQLESAEPQPLALAELTARLRQTLFPPQA